MYFEILKDENTEEYSKNLRVMKGEGNGNPLQYSCLENPMAGGAW